MVFGLGPVRRLVDLPGARYPCFPGIFPTACDHYCLLLNLLLSCFQRSWKRKESKTEDSFSQFLLCCMLLACAGLVFAIYTHRELCWLKTQIREQQKIIQTLQLGANNARDIQGSETVRIRRSAQDSCTCVGKPGRQGTRGPVGPPGSRGPRGLPGSVRHESIHLVGDGQQIRPMHHRVNYWVLKHKAGSIIYNQVTGDIEVKRTGYYFIYSQMYYYDGTTMAMGHSTYINHEKVMESVGSVVSVRRKYNTSIMVESSYFRKTTPSQFAYHSTVSTLCGIGVAFWCIFAWRSGNTRLM
ncbi:hypothetical protein OS493_010215 [Desmophyllum pertusum]|uniref:TNF family profile domain-containing protein n=1 Tax=Desmophyllum pertusum TaxID=174260 RepID=A0A9X0A349_9CNID|nr:hypothetical protein OS493_010215 [Desmophyllum pertusum]